ncbi:acetyltransferase (GNAT) family protein [Serratia fonticola]|uniref:Acetyltransferase (GNAT) family protein n=1 Tax=Serratia fonticola TaxID=47917 RepID=A0A559SZ67_SERFO|nr:GNAT family N-acetyltransferase [Serratia fonticola]TQI79850.1 acetyltransferase (GNAT) family protein [Serratia fonticola]TQI98125.1 acetyltransferase (GNAT) family protein [Serratia fonticola]TVZ67653.1 acetyltransferase (GNAT) family protein [Serratia fonticola]
MNITITDALQAEDSEEISNHLMAYNRKFVGEILNKKIGVFMLDDNGSKVAGLTGSTVGSWLSIDLLWVSESLRGEGVGSKIIKAAEQQALAAGCRFARVDTFSFQARPFYEKMGYQLQMTLHNYPVEHERYFFTKTLTD